MSHPNELLARLENERDDMRRLIKEQEAAGSPDPELIAYFLGKQIACENTLKWLDA